MDSLALFMQRYFCAINSSLCESSQLRGFLTITVVSNCLIKAKKCPQKKTVPRAGHALIKGDSHEDFA